MIHFNLRPAEIALFACVALLAPAAGWAAPDDLEVVAEPEENVQFQINEANFDQWVFQGVGSADAGRKRINSWLTLQLDEADRLCGLTDEQKLKLKLAAGGDTKRFFEEVEEVRKKFLKVKHDQNAFGELWQEIQPLQLKQAAGLFGEKSLFAKTLRKSLSADQFAKYAEVQEERHRFRYRSAVEVALLSLENSVALRGAQHEALVKLLLDKTPPPLVFGQQSQQYVMYQLAVLPAAEVKSLLDERQWTLLSRQLNNHRGIKQFLIDNGVIAKEGDDAENGAKGRNAVVPVNGVFQ